MEIITKHYKREHQYRGDELIRPVDAREFCGQAYVVVESVQGDRANMSVFVWSDAWEEATPAEWAAAVKRATKAKAKSDAHEAWLVDAKRFGVPVREGETIIVRVTKTMLFDIGGGKWSRKSGKRHQSGYHHQYISNADLAAIEATVSRRAKVDIVAERSGGLKVETPAPLFPSIEPTDP